MAYYYVKNGGTAVGDAGRYATQQTGSFAALGVAGYYDNITLAISATTSPVAGDFINPSDLHDYPTASNRFIQGSAPPPFYVVAVDDSNVDLGRTTGNFAKENIVNATIQNVYMSGVQFNISSDMNNRENVYIEDSVLNLTGINSDIRAITDGTSITLVGVEIATDHITNNIEINYGATFTMLGGSVSTTTIGLNGLFFEAFVNGGGFVLLEGVDISAVTGTILLNVGGDAGTDDTISVRFDMCKIATGVAFTNETFKSYNQRALFTRCSDSSAAAEYQYHLHAFGGDVDDDSAIYRNEDEPFTESNQKISYKIVTNSDASLGSPLWFDFPIKDYAVLSVGATDTLRFYLTSNTALTNKDIYVEISYPDGTNKQTPNFLSSAPTTVGGTLDLMAAGTTLTTDGASTYTGGLTNKYIIDVDTSVDVGADTVPIVKVYITLPSVTIQLASEFGQV